MRSLSGKRLKYHGFRIQELQKLAVMLNRFQTLSNQLIFHKNTEWSTVDWKKNIWQKSEKNLGISKSCTPLRTNISPWEWMVWRCVFFLKWSRLRGHVNFRGGTFTWLSEKEYCKMQIAWISITLHFEVEVLAQGIDQYLSISDILRSTNQTVPSSLL